MSETTKRGEMSDPSALLGSTAGEDHERQSPRRGDGGESALDKERASAAAIAVTLLSAGFAGDSNVEGVKWLAGEAEMLNEQLMKMGGRCDVLYVALRDLLDVISADDLIPESVSYVRQARAALGDRRT